MLWVTVLSGVFEGKKTSRKAFGEGGDALMVILRRLRVSRTSDL
jgi:hypothetical protein